MKIADIQLVGELYVSLLERLYKEHDHILSLDKQPNENITITEILCSYDTGNETQKTIHFDGIRIFKQYYKLYVPEQHFMYIEYNIDENNKLEIYCLGGCIKSVSEVELIITYKVDQNNAFGIIGANYRIRPNQNNTKICKTIYDIFGKIQTLLNVYEHRGTTING